jgi:hypothetical protein
MIWSIVPDTPDVSNLALLPPSSAGPETLSGRICKHNGPLEIFANVWPLAAMGKSNHGVGKTSLDQIALVQYQQTVTLE